MNTLGRRVAAMTSVVLVVAAGIWAWTLYSVYFAGGQSHLPRPDPSSGVQVIPITDGFFTLVGAGGNITVSTGPDGVLLVDTGYIEMTPAVTKALKSITDQPVAAIVNTHFHHDHAEGNAALSQNNSGTYAHANSLANMLELLGDPFTEGDLPTFTFQERHQFHFNGQTVELIHTPQSHTNGDIIAVFRPANVIAAGDTLSTDALPFLSLGTGATLDGHLAAQDLLLALADEATHIVPGHGEMTDRDALSELNTDLRRIRNRLARLKSWGVPRRLRTLFHPLAGWPRSRQRDGDWEKYWTGLAWDSLP